MNLKIAGDGRKGCPDEGPYDAIHVGAGATEIPKAVWLKTFIKRSFYKVFFVY